MKTDSNTGVPRRVRDPRRGYILLVVIAVLVATTTALAQLATATTAAGQSAADGLRDLQQRWAEDSIRRTILGNASLAFRQRDERLGQLSDGEDDNRLTDRDDEIDTPPAYLTDSVSLSGRRYDIRLDDENAKLDLNHFYQWKSSEPLRRWIAAESGLAGVVRLQPAVPPRSDPNFFRSDSDRDDIANDAAASDDDDASQDPDVESTPRAFRSWGEVFDLPSLRRTAGNDALPTMAVTITIGGISSLNVRHATDDVFVETARWVVGQATAERILRRYRKNPNVAIDAILQSEVSDPREQRQLATLLSESSDCFSLWIDSVDHSRPRRTWHLRRSAGEGVGRRESFSF